MYNEKRQLRYIPHYNESEVSTETTVTMYDYSNNVFLFHRTHQNRLVSVLEITHCHRSLTGRLIRMTVHSCVCQVGTKLMTFDHNKNQ